MEKPLVTIAMITYNSAKYLEVAIESVLGQTYTNLELIISDDASKDNTWSIVQSYNDSRIRAYRNENNIGEYPNRNQTISLARGKYFLFIDGDDVLYPYGLNFMVTMLEAFPNCSMALSLPPRSYFLYPVQLSPQQVYSFDFFGDSVTHHGFPYTLFKTSVLKEAGELPVSIKQGDTYIKKKICLKHNVLLIAEGTAWWRETPGQASSKLKHDMLGQIEALHYNLFFLSHEDCPLNVNEIKVARENVVGSFLRQVIRNYYFRLRIVKGIQISKKARIRWRDLSSIFKKATPYYTSGSSSTEPLTDRLKDPFFKRLELKVQ